MRAAPTFAMVIGLAIAVPATATEAPTEVAMLDGQKVTVHAEPFLSAQELATLRAVATNRQALAVFVTGTKGFAAIAVAPDEGFIRNGAPVASATAVGELPDAEAARKAARAACDKARSGGKPCVIVLEVGPPG